MSLPLDLFSDVISWTWNSSLNPQERVQFMIASRLVSKAWSATHDKVSSLDAHIPCESFYRHFFRGAADRLAQCKHITFTVCNRRDGRETAPPSLTYMRCRDMKRLVSLRTIHLVYYDMMFPDPYIQVFFYALPSYLERLIISYDFSPRIPLSAINTHLMHFTRYSQTRYAEPLVGTLEVNGADDFVTAVWESLFPYPGKLLMDGEEVRLMRVTSGFNRGHALSVLVKDSERQKLAARRRQIKALTGNHSADTDAGGVAFVTAKTTHVISSGSSPVIIDINEIGAHVWTLPTPWFNTYKLNAVGEFTHLGTYERCSHVLEKLLKG